MFEWLHKKEKEVQPSAQPVVVEVPMQPVNCAQPFEHSALSKIRELQLERDNIKAELERLSKSAYMPQTPEFNRYAEHLARHMSAEFPFDRVYMWDSTEFSKWQAHASYLLEQSLLHCSYEVDFAKIACELNELRSRKSKIKSKNERLKRIDEELKSLKKSLGVE